MIKNIIFDLDGTLADSILDIYNCVNSALTHFNIKTISLEDARQFVGKGAGRLVKKAANKYSDSTENEEEIYQFYLKYYEQHCVDNTKLYDGVYETLELLYNHNINMFVISNKPNKMTLKTTEKLNISKYFKAIIGDGVYPYRKPDVNIWHSLKKDYDLTEDETIMVGDGIPDYEFACNAGIKCLLVLYGITDKNILLELKNNYYLNSFNEIADYIINKKF
ncbi:haloacid dehalogenase [Brachyspira suanatina]|uniref:phosphoglycolate phosphatase n=1 Tax=Brachyspira suanatina TaxID=381802 RepID=A0A0G4K8D9_9SPIR|nr:HAD family hydrolase [Brachyspira suanatina]CRF33671.1 haloacid dehalogenase [Brachyspira suanatina]